MNELVNVHTKGRGALLRSIPNLLAFYALVVLVVESVVAIAATVAFWDQVMLLFILFVILIVALLLIVLLVTFMGIKYPRILLGKFEEVTDDIIGGLSDFQKRTLLEISQKGELEYKEDDRNVYKDLRNGGLVRTSNRRRLKHGESLLLTPLGTLIAEEIKRRGS